MKELYATAGNPGIRIRVPHGPLDETPAGGMNASTPVWDPSLPRSLTVAEKGLLIAGPRKQPEIESSRVCQDAMALRNPQGLSRLRPPGRRVIAGSGPLGFPRRRGQKDVVCPGETGEMLSPNHGGRPLQAAGRRVVIENF